MVGTSRFLRLLLVLAVVLAASLIGILTRPPGLLATFWCANAILLGMMVRWPVLIEWRTWIAAAVGYVCADLITGNSLSLALHVAGATLPCGRLGFLVWYYV